jgi:8-oxo-dGTP pyrophosphatase MutT (NUDIX family)
LIAAIPPHDLEERATIAWVLQWIDAGYPLWRTAKPATPPVHLVSYVALVDGPFVLLVDHRDAGLWLPPGGHVDPHEAPAHTAARELHEELGRGSEGLDPSPQFLTKTVTVGHSAGHTDISLWFVVQADRAESFTADTSEFDRAKWFSMDALPPNTDPHLRRFLAKLHG